jgi:penicillin-insensitive murein DD-endopeptidase
MKIGLSYIFLCLLTACASTQVSASAISEIKDPSKGPTAVFGTYNAGCIGGAKPLHVSGTGYEAMRASRNRFYGHPNMVSLIAQAGARFGKESPILIGDVSQPRGGPMPSGHASHQVGLDADIWLQRVPQWNEQFREKLEFKTVVQSDGKAVDPSLWRTEYGEWIKWFANQTDVERIFVNPAIKKRLCQDFNEAAWLQKVRPWFGHDEHFHVRLRCPADQPKCRGQVPPAGVECGKELDSWFEPEPTPDPNQPAPTPRPFPKLPSECKGVFDSRAADLHSFDEPY